LSERKYCDKTASTLETLASVIMQGNKTALLQTVNKTQQVFYIINRLRTTTGFRPPMDLFIVSLFRLPNHWLQNFLQSLLYFHGGCLSLITMRHAQRRSLSLFLPFPTLLLPKSSSGVTLCTGADLWCFSDQPKGRIFHEKIFLRSEGRDVTPY